ncbi:50S ribosomal protein L9 [bacterium]|nr:MAG: 50S ribosomal protein L9 [bacterium]
MDVILMQSVDNLGGMGETVSVSRGYARNYLIPQGLAMVASDGARKVVEQHMKIEAKRDLVHKASAETLAAQIGELSCTLTVQADDDDNLFGSVGAREIATGISTDAVTIERRQIVLEEPIKQLGVYTVPVKLHAEVAMDAKVWVVRA